EPAAPPGDQEVRVLAIPADAGAVGGLPVDERVVIGEDAAAPPCRPQRLADRRERVAERAVVVLPGVAGHAADRSGTAGAAGGGAAVLRRRPTRWRRAVGLGALDAGAPVGPGPDDEGTRVRQRPA